MLVISRRVLYPMSLLVFFVAISLGMGAVAQVSDEELATLQAKAVEKGWTFDIGRTNASLRPHGQLADFQLPAPNNAYWKSVPLGKPGDEKASLPSSWDWRALDGVTAVKDQGSCGSCWAFSTIGVVEAAIKIADGVEEDLAEQHILSCNTANWGCAGATWGYAWLLNTPDACGRIGAAFEAEYPYTAARWECDCAPQRLYRIEGYSYVNGLQPSVIEMKQALMVHGPLGCSLYTSPVFSTYSGGVFNANDNPSVFDIDHAIVLVGWDDSMGANGAWIIKNSWGTDWGISGFGYIEYGCNLVGYAANYVLYKGSQSGIQVSPLSGFASAGPLGGPFSPTSTTYTVSNQGTASLRWQATGPAWLDIAPADGMLAPGANISVSIAINASATLGGVLGGDVLFRNQLTGESQRRWVSLTLPKTPVYNFPLDTNPGWSTTGAWAYGPPQGYNGARGADPAAAYSGSAVYGYNLAGYYANSLAKQYLTTTALDFTNWQDVELRFQRWLGVESSKYDHASIEYSLNGTQWTSIWTHEGGNLAESAWSERVVQLPAAANGAAAVYVRWVMGTANSSNNYAGWNLDDIAFLANPLQPAPEGEGEPVACDVDSLNNIFSMLLMIGDSNSDGALSQTEVVTYVADIGTYWSAFDLDANGILDRAEFTGNMLVQGFLPDVDANGDNAITLAELNALTDIITSEMFALVDKDQSGGIDCGDLGFIVEPPCEECPVIRKPFYLAGEDACLGVPGGTQTGIAYQWSKDGIGALAEGRCLGVHCATLRIPNLEEEDSGTYTCSYGEEKALYSVTIQVTAHVPASTIAGLVFLMALTVFAATLRTIHPRRR